MKNIIIVAVVIVAALAGSFYGGMIFEQNSKKADFGQFGQNRQMGANADSAARGMRANNSGGFTTGEIISKDDKSVTIKLNNGGSKIIFFSPSVQILKSSLGSTDDLINGEIIIATGNANSDGSVSAQTIQVRPPMPVNQQGQQNQQ